jgi:ribonucleotide monophosphatase NagD (HAD superfamily)
LILTGVTSRDDLAASPIQPDFVFETLDSLVQALQKEPER